VGAGVVIIEVRVLVIIYVQRRGLQIEDRYKQ